MCLGARIMLTINLWTTRDLCNGSMGVIKDLMFQEGDHPQFDEYYTGPNICLNEPRCVSIVPQTNVSDLLGVSHERQQLPLKLYWAITIHKSQGLTLNKAWVDIGKSETFDGLFYVGLSRVRRLNDLIIEPISFERLSVKNRKGFEFRVTEEKRLESISIETMGFL